MKLENGILYILIGGQNLLNIGYYLNFKMAYDTVIVGIGTFCVIGVFYGYANIEAYKYVKEWLIKKQLEYGDKKKSLLEFAKEHQEESGLIDIIYCGIGSSIAKRRFKSGGFDALIKELSH